jgi:hypothetical protein
LSGIALGLGHPEQPLSHVRRRDARSAQIGGPNGITQSFQVSAYSGEPFTSKAARNLLAKDDWRTALGDKASPFRPEMSTVGCPLTFPRNGEGLTWTAPRPDGAVARPSGKAQRLRPSGNPREEMCLRVVIQVLSYHGLKVAPINIPVRNMSFVH